jgi:uncharacterized protein
MADAPRAADKRRFTFRPWLRAVHRDMGYVAVGLTLIYALSGLVVNHIGDGWDPNFTHESRTHEIGGPLPEGDADAERFVRERLGIADPPKEVYRQPVGEDDDELELRWDRRTLHVDVKTGHVTDEEQSPRFFVRFANWLHLNRGKKAWTYVADAYAVGLMLLALSGLFMLPGKKGLLGRGAVFVILGIAIPVVYVTLSGGP